MKLLLITSDWKWTGPAEPMLRLARGLRTRGDEVWIACPRPPEPVKRCLADEAERAGFRPALDLAYAHGQRPLADRADLRNIEAFVADRGIELVHAWHTRDHLLAWRALGFTRRRRRAALVRWYRTAARIRRDPLHRLLYGSGCDGLLCVSPRTAEANAGLCRGPVRGVFGAVDTERFSPGPPDAAVRGSLGLSGQHHVVGIVARAQRRRRFEVLLEAARQLFERDPDARLLIVGRGTHRGEVAESPARRLGIADRVIFSGYRVDDYLDVLRCIDVFTFLVPGSDGTCRAVLEALALGTPVVATHRGALPEIVSHGRTGFVMEEDPAALALGWERLLADPALRAEMGAAARREALERFTIPRFAEEVADFYHDVLSPGQDPGIGVASPDVVNRVVRR